MRKGMSAPFAPAVEVVGSSAIISASFPLACCGELYGRPRRGASEGPNLPGPATLAVFRVAPFAGRGEPVQAGRREPGFGGFAGEGRAPPAPQFWGSRTDVSAGEGRFASDGEVRLLCRSQRRRA